MLQPVDSIEPAAHVELLGSLEEVRNRRVFFVTAKDLLGFQCPSVRWSVPATYCHCGTR
jgi:hypothetical protein